MSPPPIPAPSGDSIAADRRIKVKLKLELVFGDQKQWLSPKESYMDKGRQKRKRAEEEECLVRHPLLFQVICSKSSDA